MKKKITWILVGDGSKATVLRSEGWGSGLTPVLHGENPAGAKPTRELGADRPGRGHNRTGTGRHGLEPRVEWQEHEKHQFARRLADILDDAVKARKFDRLVLVAPPKVLGDLRTALGEPTRRRVTAEIDKDLTHLPVPQLVEQLAKVTPV